MEKNTKFTIKTLRLIIRTPNRTQHTQIESIPALVWFQTQQNNSVNITS